LALPTEIREFIDQFDRGLLTDYQGEVGQIDMRRLSELARTMPIPLGRQNTWGNSLIKSQSSPIVQSSSSAQRELAHFDLRPRSPPAPSLLDFAAFGKLLFEID
jgi:hypothetical protein